MQVINNLIITETGARLPVEKITAYKSEEYPYKDGNRRCIEVLMGENLCFRGCKNMAEFDQAYALAWDNYHRGPEPPAPKPRKKYTAKELVAQFVQDTFHIGKGECVSAKQAAELFQFWGMQRCISGMGVFSGDLLDVLIRDVYGDDVFCVKAVDGQFYWQGLVLK